MARSMPLSFRFKTCRRHLLDVCFELESARFPLEPAGSSLHDRRLEFFKLETRTAGLAHTRK